MELRAGCLIFDAKRELCRNRGTLGNQDGELLAHASPAGHP